jgi:molybdopterin-guanine dinucleotide biosynthesis protein A
MFPLTLAIAAGGQSTRMGRDKALLPLWGQPIIERILAQLQPLASETLIVTNRPAAYAYLQLPLFTDVWPGKGALGGLYTALHSATQPHVLCVACDMPFTVRPLMEYLLGLRTEADVVLPQMAGEAEPFRAVYARSGCLAAVQAALTAGQMRMISFLPAVRVRYVPETEWARFDPQHRSFFNINTPADLAQAEQLLTEEGL